MLTGLSDNLLKSGYHAGFKKIEQWIMKSRHSKCSFALSTYSEVRNKPLTIKTYSHKPVQTYSNKPRTFLLCEKQWCNSGVGKYKVAAQCWSVKKLLPAVRNQSQIGQKVTGTTDIRRHCGCH